MYTSEWIGSKHIVRDSKDRQTKNKNKRERERESRREGGGIERKREREKREHSLTCTISSSTCPRPILASMASASFSCVHQEKYDVVLKYYSSTMNHNIQKKNQLPCAYKQTWTTLTLATISRRLFVRAEVDWR